MDSFWKAALWTNWGIPKLLRSSLIHFIFDFNSFILHSGILNQKSSTSLIKYQVFSKGSLPRYILMSHAVFVPIAPLATGTSEMTIRISILMRGH